jgi:lipopolysaccharide transport system permease protein
MTTAQVEQARPATPDAHTGGVIEPPRGWALPDLRAMWAYRDLLFFLARRDVAVRYKQTVIGVAWAVLQPLVFALALSLFLGLVFRTPSEGVPRSVFVLCGLTMWLFFAETLARCSTSSLESAQLITKVWFPRMIVPLAAAASPAADFLAAFVVLVIFLLASGVTPDWPLLALPGVVALGVLTAVGAGLWLSALVVRYRDIQVAIPLVVQLGLFATPVLYTLDVVPDKVQWLYALNPMVGVLEGFRWTLLPGAAAPGALLLVPLVTSVVLLVTGALFFTRAERTFADVI